MKDTITFVKPGDLKIIIGEEDIILRKGFVHLNEVIIDRIKSTDFFVEVIRQLQKEGRVTVAVGSEQYEDLLQLCKMQLINKEIIPSILVIGNKEIIPVLKNSLQPEIEILASNQILSRKEALILAEDKSANKVVEILKEEKSFFNKYEYIYLLENFSNIIKLRAYNRLLFELDKDYTFGFYDTENVYLTNVQPGLTGCYECLEKHIITKFEGDMNLYIKKSGNKEEGYASEKMILCGLVLKDIENVNIYGNTSLGGQVLHFYLPNFEYSFNVNRRHVACDCCAGINKVMFEEQNVKAVNIIKEIIK